MHNWDGHPFPCPVLLQVWATALKEDSPLLLPATLAKLSVEEAAATAQLCSLLLLQQAQHLDQAAVAAVSRLLLAASLHYSAHVRRAATRAVGQCLADKPKLAGHPSGPLSAVHGLGCMLLLTVHACIAP